MRGISLATLDCSIARTLDVVGERWTLLVLRDAFNGARRFEDFTRHLPIARNVLTERLRTLVAHGVLRRQRYAGRPARYEYRLTAKGLELYPVLIGLLQWGDRHLTDKDGPPIDVVHRECGGRSTAIVVCATCDERLAAPDTRGVPAARRKRRPRSTAAGAAKKSTTR